MIPDHEIGVVVQGDVRANTLQALAALRGAFPKANVVFATYPGESVDWGAISSLVDRVVLCDDPGALPPTVISPTAPPNNINRQIVTTQAGIASLDTSFVLKLRSDMLIEHRGLVDAWASQADRDGVPGRILVPNLYTRHPDGINGYLFHPSDWLQFGRRSDVASFWDATLMPEEVARWYESRPHEPGATATARRFRARMTQEQWVATQYAAKLGYQVPRYLHDRAEGLSENWRRFLGAHLQIVDTTHAGLAVPGHQWAASSLFQRLDCVSSADWHALCSSAASKAQTDPLRFVARRFRFALARGVLARKWIKSRLANANRAT